MQAIAEPLFQEVNLKKGDRGPQRDVSPSDPKALHYRLPRLDSRLGIELLEALLDSPAREVIEGALHDGARPPDDRGVQARLVVPNESLLEEAPLQVGEGPPPA